MAVTYGKIEFGRDTGQRMTVAKEIPIDHIAVIGDPPLPFWRPVRVVTVEYDNFTHFVSGSTTSVKPTEILDTQVISPRPLEDIKPALRSRVKAAFADRLDAGCPYKGKLIKCDDASVAAMVSISTGPLPEANRPDGTYAWRCKDNSWLTLSPTDGSPDHDIVPMVNAVRRYVSCQRNIMWSKLDWIDDPARELADFVGYDEHKDWPKS